MVQIPSGFSPPQEPDRGLLLKMTPMAITAMEMDKMPDLSGPDTPLAHLERVRT